MAKNKNLHEAKKNKKDNFFTMYEDVKKEVESYDPKEFEDKVVYCNADDYRWSNFVKYFKDNFNRLKLKKLIATNFDIGDGAYKYTYDGKEEIIEQLKGNGSFDSEECLEILDKETDMVITNPPFSLWRHYFKVCMEPYL